MIRVHNLSKYYPTKAGAKYVFRNLNFILPNDRDIAILGGNGSGKSTLLRIMAGLDHGTHGKIITKNLLSWPLALSTGLVQQMTGRENVRFIVRLYGMRANPDVEAYVAEFAELGAEFDEPIKNYSSGMRAKFNFALSMGFNFDTYLIDEIMSVGDVSFKKKCTRALEEKRQSANIILVSHDLATIREHCNAALLLAYGQAEFYENVENAILRYRFL